MTRHPFLDNNQVRALSIIAAHPGISSLKLAAFLDLEPGSGAKPSYRLRACTRGLQPHRFARFSPFQGWTAAQLGRLLLQRLRAVPAGTGHWGVITWETEKYSQVGYLIKATHNGSQVTFEVGWLPCAGLQRDPDVADTITVDLAAEVNLDHDPEAGSLEITTPSGAIVTLVEFDTELSKALGATAVRPAA